MSGLLPVEEAQARLLALRAPLASENITFSELLGRYLSNDVVALRDQPAAPLSAMDGYAIRFDDLPGPWSVIGETAAGAAPDRSVEAGEAMRIFTMAPERKAAISARAPPISQPAIACCRRARA